MMADGTRPVLVPPPRGTLDFVEELLRARYGWAAENEYFVIRGATSATKRAEAIGAFNHDHHGRARAFLLSTGAGALGINLVGANHVVLLDVSFNPAIDAQVRTRTERRRGGGRSGDFRTRRDDDE